MNYDVTLVVKYLFSPFIFEGALITVGLTVASMLLGILFGMILAMAKLSQRVFLTGPADVYIGFFRGTPLLVQLIAIYTGLPQVGLDFSVLESAVLALSLNQAAYNAEIIRAGIISVDPGQTEAARSLGMSYFQNLRLIVIPQSVRIMLPPLGNELISLLKSTSLAAVISLEELLRRTQLIVADTYRTLELFTVASIYYLILTFLLSELQRRLERRLSRHWIVEGTGAPPREHV